MARKPTMGTNPYTWALPTAATALGFDVVLDFATSVMSNGAVKVLRRDGRRAPPGAIFDAEGRPTEDPAAFASHACFGGHKVGGRRGGGAFSLLLPVPDSSIISPSLICLLTSAPHPF